jgi:hypothetical protein
LFVAASFASVFQSFFGADSFFYQKNIERNPNQNLKGAAL